MKIAIVVGHDNQNGGAVMAPPFEYINEYCFNRVLAAQIKIFAHKKGNECHVFLRDKVGLRGAYEDVDVYNPDCCVELHYNSFGSDEPVGTETLFGAIKNSNSLADEVHKQILVALLRTENQDRGVKFVPHDGRGGFSVNNNTNVPSILIEPFFGSNTGDSATALELICDLALGIVDGCMFWHFEMNKKNEAH